MKILITGKGGQLGTTLEKGISGHELTVVGIDELDLSKPDQIHGILSNYDFDCLINTAAYTAVDQAESEEELAQLVNGDSVGQIAKHCKERGAKFIHFSTDFVFDGLLSRPYLEDDRCNPINVYGATKLDGEMQAVAMNSESIIIRTSWVYSVYGKNFLKTMFTLGQDREKLTVVKDQIGSPTSTRTLLKVTSAVIENDVEPGVYHVSDEGVASWYDFAVCIMKLAELDCKVFPIPATDYPTPAKRPGFSVMNKSKITSALGLDLPHWEEALSEVITQLKNE